ncbi:MAG: flippase-like domain-containing protein [Chitinophagaceae bacterium]|nr:flippase-like domain-containing protein [Chitinophagaceae bacterium]
MNKRLISILQYTLFLGAGIFLVWWQLKGMTAAQKTQFTSALSNANYWLIIPIVFMSLLSHLSRAYRWKLLLEPLDYYPKIKNVFAVTMVGYLANAAIPRLGEILKCTFLSRYEHIKVEKLVGSILIERTFDLFCFVLFIGITVLIQVDKIGGFIKEKIASFADNAGMPLWGKGLIVVTIITLIYYGLNLLVKKYPENKNILKVNIFFKGIGQGFIAIRSLKKRNQFIAHTVFIWAMYLLQIYVGFKAMEHTIELDMRAACSVLVLATFAMIITPNGIGLFPIFVMQTLILYGIESAYGTAFGWLIWGVATSIILVVGFICLLLLPYINKQKNEISTSHTG